MRLILDLAGQVLVAFRVLGKQLESLGLIFGGALSVVPCPLLEKPEGQLSRSVARRALESFLDQGEGLLIAAALGSDSDCRC